MLKEIHEGSCGSHNGPRALVGKNIQTRVLLANGNQRHSLTSATLWGLPTFSNTFKQTRGTNHINLPNLASSMMGNGPRRTTTNRPWKPLLHGGHHRVLHQMDRSETTGHNNLADSQEVFLAANHMLLQSAKRTHSGQWNSI